MAEHSNRTFVRRFIMVFGSLAAIALIGLVYANVVSTGVEDHPQVREALTGQQVPVIKAPQPK